MHCAALFGPLTLSLFLSLCTILHRGQHDSRPQPTTLYTKQVSFFGPCFASELDGRALGDDGVVGRLVVQNVRSFDHVQYSDLKKIKILVTIQFVGRSRPENALSFNQRKPLRGMVGVALTGEDSTTIFEEIRVEATHTVNSK